MASLGTALAVGALAGLSHGLPAQAATKAQAPTELWREYPLDPRESAPGTTPDRPAATPPASAVPRPAPAAEDTGGRGPSPWWLLLLVPAGAGAAAARRLVVERRGGMAPSPAIALRPRRPMPSTRLARTPGPAPTALEELAAATARAAQQGRDLSLVLVTPVAPDGGVASAAAVQRNRWRLVEALGGSGRVLTVSDTEDPGGVWLVLDQVLPGRAKAAVGRVREAVASTPEPPVSIRVASLPEDGTTVEELMARCRPGAAAGSGRHAMPAPAQLPPGPDEPPVLLPARRFDRATGRQPRSSGARHCEVVWRPGAPAGRFVAIEAGARIRPGARSAIVAASAPLPMPSRRPPRATEEATAALGALEAEIRALGWEPAGAGSLWFSRQFTLAAQPSALQHDVAASEPIVEKRPA